MTDAATVARWLTEVAAEPEPEPERMVFVVPLALADVVRTSPLVLARADYYALDVVGGEPVLIRST